MNRRSFFASLAVAPLALVVAEQAPVAASQTIRIEGIDSNALFSGRAIKELLERLQEAQKDGGKLLF
jgi:hypothetical protein